MYDEDISIVDVSSNDNCSKDDDNSKMEQEDEIEIVELDGDEGSETVTQPPNTDQHLTKSNDKSSPGAKVCFVCRNIKVVDKCESCPEYLVKLTDVQDKQGLFVAR